MTNPAIAAASLFIRGFKKNRPACERRIFPLCH
jgi:hypothetical protein